MRSTAVAYFCPELTTVIFHPNCMHYWYVDVLNSYRSFIARGHRSDGLGWLTVEVGLLGLGPVFNVTFELRCIEKIYRKNH